MLQVYYTEFREDSGEDGLLQLSEYRRKKLAAAASAQRRRQMIAAELLLNQAVRELFPQIPLPLDIVEGEWGKPGVRSESFFFSISHSGPYVACAIADHEIGLDIQQRSTKKDALARRFFSDEERQYLLRSVDGDAAFTEIWCLKESYVKAIGTGLTTPFSTFSIDFSDPLCLAGDPGIRFWLYGEEDLHMAVCSLNGKSPEPNIIHKTELRLQR